MKNMVIKHNDYNSKQFIFANILRSPLGTSTENRDDNVMDQNNSEKKQKTKMMMLLQADGIVGENDSENKQETNMKMQPQEHGIEVIYVIKENSNKDMFANVRENANFKRVESDLTDVFSNEGNRSVWSKLNYECPDSDSIESLNDWRHDDEKVDSISTLEEEEEYRDEDECFGKSVSYNDYDTVSSDDVVEMAKNNFTSKLSLYFARYLKIVASKMSSVSNSIEDNILIKNASKEVSEYNNVDLEWEPWVDDSIEANVRLSSVIYYIDTKQGKRKLVQRKALNHDLHI